MDPCTQSDFVVSESPIDPARFVLGVSAPAHGAQNFFFGAVREQNHGKTVVAVAYDAFEPLACAVLSEIAAEARARWGASLVIRVAHRTGRLSVGELSVAIGVSAPHRDESYQASRYVIEQIKLRAPIWKKEFYDSGETAWLKGHALCAHGPEVEAAGEHRDSESAPSVFGAILAGGASSRMGSDKRVLDWNGKSWAEHTRDRLASAIGVPKDRILLLGDLKGDWITIPDLRPGRLGPLAGLEAGLSELLAQGQEGTWLVILPVDMPELPIHEIAKLANQASCSDDRIDAVCFEGLELPAAIRVRFATLSRVVARLERSMPRERSLQGLFGELAIQTLSRGSKELFGNFNTPEEISGQKGARDELAAR